MPGSLFTLLSVTLMTFPLVTLVSGMVTVFPLTVTIPPLLVPPLPMAPAPEVTCAWGLPLTTTFAG